MQNKVQTHGKQRLVVQVAAQGQQTVRQGKGREAEDMRAKDGGMKCILGTKNGVHSNSGLIQDQKFWVLK